MLEGFKSYQPTKTQTFWLCVAAIAATIVIGFTAGGWVTASTAEEMAEKAAEKAHVALAADICVAQFKRSEDPVAKLEKLKSTRLYSRDELVESEGWALMPGRSGVDPETADACVERLMALDSSELRAAQAQAAAADASVTQGATTTQ